MRRPACILMLALFWQASFSRANLAPYNKSGVTWGHIHLHPKDRYKETLALLSLGGELGNNLSPNVPLVFPGILILLQEGQKPPTGGSEGTVVDHIGFQGERELLQDDVRSHGRRRYAQPAGRQADVFQIRATSQIADRYRARSY